MKKVQATVEEIVKKKVLKKGELKALKVAMSNVSNLPGKKFAYAINKNFKRVVDELEENEKIEKKHSEVVTLLIEMINDLKKKYATKDSEGNVKVKKTVLGDFTVDMISKQKYAEELEALKKTNEKEYKELESDEKEFEVFLQMPAEFEIYYINFDDIPESITPGQMDGIGVLIEGFEE